MCGIYLALVVAAWGLVVVDMFFPDPQAVGASFAAAPGILLTVPTSFLLSAPVGAVVSYATAAAPTASSLIGTFLVIVGSGLIQAAIVYLLLRGPRIESEALTAPRR